MKSIVIILGVLISFSGRAQDQFSESTYFEEGKFKKNKINKGAFYQRNRPFQGDYENAYQPTVVSDVVRTNGELVSFKISDCSKLRDGAVFNVLKKENKSGQQYAYGFEAKNPYVADKIFAFFHKKSLYVVYGGPPYLISGEVYIYAILGAGELPRKKLQELISATFQGDFDLSSKEDVVHSTTVGSHADSQIEQLKKAGKNEYHVLSSSNGYTQSYYDSKIVVNSEGGFFKSITVGEDDFYADNIAYPRYFGSESGSRYSVIDGKLYTWRQDGHQIKVTGVGVQSGKVKKIDDGHKKNVSQYMSDNEAEANQAKQNFANSKNNIIDFLIGKAEGQISDGNYSGAKNTIFEYQNVAGLNDSDPVFAKLYKECEEGLSQQQDAAQNSAETARLERLKNDPKSTYGKDIAKIEVIIKKYDKSSYPAGYSSYFSHFSVNILATMTDGSTILSKNTDHWMDSENALINYQKTDFNVDVYGCKGERGQYWMYPFKNDMYSPEVSVKVTSKYDSQISTSIKVPMQYTEPVEMDYINHQANETQNGRDLTVEVWGAKNKFNDDKIILYDIYQDGTLLNTVYLKPNVDLWVYTKGSGSPRGKDGSVAVVVKNPKVEGIYSVKTDTKILSTPALNNSSNNSSSTSTSSEITIKNNTGKSVCIAHYGGSTVINNGSSESFSCRDLYYGVMDGANCTGTKGALIANKSQCGQTISLD